ncbi:hypothetical protein MY4038_010229 [Beauveria bassiana]|uniref:Uncharacterized protein n=1 Tax=Beauveria bassiana TaxID=176275 RepID=A0A2N6NUM9_BEABA|nr:hypothetical protein BM221_003431 [Beauveria bassiana]
MARSCLVALLLASGAAASKLLVTSYAGTIMTLGTESTSPSGGKYPAIKAVATFQGCKESPSWLTLDHCGSLQTS